MNNNMIFKKIVIANRFQHFEIKEMFELGGCKLSSSQVKALMAGSQNKNYEKATDEQLEQFLEGVIVYMRGKLENKAQLPRMVENYIIGLVESSNEEAIDEIHSLLGDVCDSDDEDDEEEATEKDGEEKEAI
ncbi:MAG: DUF1456 family protein [Mariprofundaceae bacterium]|nr:DUF1456 family protein [Mariprofundaceae bacterium]